MKPGESAADLQAEVERLRREVAEARAGKDRREPEPEALGVTLLHGAKGWEIHLGEISEREAKLYGEVVAEFMRARQERRAALDPEGRPTCRPGSTVVKADEVQGRGAAIHGQSITFTRRKVG